MYLKKKLLTSKYKTISFFDKRLRMCQCIMQLIIPLNNKLFFNSYTIKMAIKNKKTIIGKLQISIGKTIYI